MAEWLIEEGIGETRALLVEGEQVRSARLLWPGELAAGARTSGQLTAKLKGTRRGLALLENGTEALVDHLPAGQNAQARLVPVYEDFEGWSGSTAGARSWADLPAQAIKYVRRIEELIGAPVAILSTSPERDDTILVQNPFEA